MNHQTQRYPRIVPPPGPGRGLALAQLANSLGDGAFLVTSALYFTRVVGLSATQVGLGLTVGWAAGFLAGVPLGSLADRRGPRGTAILLALTTALAVSAFLVVRSYAAFLVAVCAYTVSQCGLAAARQALLAGLVDPGRRTEVRAYLQSTLNGGLAVGAALGGVALSLDTRAAYLTVLALDAASFVTAALVLHRLPAVRRSAPAAGGVAPRLAVLRDRPYAVLALLNAIMLLYMPMLSVVIPLWIVQRTEAPTWMVSAMLVLNTVGVMLFQVRVARQVTGLASAARMIRHAGALMMACCAVFTLSAGSSAWGAAAALLVAAGLQVLGELKLAAGSWEISFGLAPADSQGQYQGFFGSGAAVARMVGPLLLTTLVLTWGRPGWIALGALFAIAGLGVAPAVRWAERTHAVPVPVAA